MRNLHPACIYSPVRKGNYIQEINCVTKLVGITEIITLLSQYPLLLFRILPMAFAEAELSLPREVDGNVLSWISVDMEEVGY